MSNVMSGCCPSSKILLHYLNNWKRNPTLEVDLGEILETYITQIDLSNEDTNNSDINFAETAVFIQNWATLYDKKVDLLLKNFLKLHLALCDVSSTPQNEEPAAEDTNASTENNETVPPNNAQEEVKQKQKKKKKENVQEQPLLNTIENPQPSTSSAPDIVFDPEPQTSANQNEGFSSNEMEEIGVLWQMLNKIEKKKIENILHNLDENEGINALEELLNQEANISKTLTNESNITQEELLELIQKELQISDVANTTINTSTETIVPDVSLQDNSQANFDMSDCHLFEDLIDLNTEEMPDEENVIVEDQVEPEIIPAPNEDASTILEETIGVNKECNEETENIQTIEPSSPDHKEMRIHCLKEVQVRLEQLSQDMIPCKEKVTKSNLKELKADLQVRVERLPEHMLQKMPVSAKEIELTLCRNCSGCKSVEELSALSERHKIPYTSEKRKLLQYLNQHMSKRKLNIERDPNDSPKRIRLQKSITVASSDFENFCNYCLPNLEWQDGELVFNKNNRLQDLPIQDDEDIEDTLEAYEDNLDDLEDNLDINADIPIPVLPEVQTNLTNFRIQKNSEDEESTNTEETENIALNIEDYINNVNTEESGLLVLDFGNLTIREPSAMTSKDLMNETNRNIEETMEDAGLNTTFSTQLSGVLDKTGEEFDDCISEMFDYPHTPAVSEDSGRFSMSACHSDVETESHINRTSQSDSGVEMPHDDDDRLSTTNENPFKDLDAASLSFYKKKCESLIEQRERNQKMKEWENFLKEKDKEKEKLGVYNIAEYEEKILNSFEEIKEEKSLESIVTGNSVEEVCRYFLASLQLANMGNLSIRDDHPGEATQDGVKLQCLSKERYYDNLNEPSSSIDSLFVEEPFDEPPMSHSTPSTSRYKRKKYS